MPKINSDFFNSFYEDDEEDEKDDTQVEETEDDNPNDTSSPDVSTKQDGESDEVEDTDEEQEVDTVKESDSESDEEFFTNIINDGAEKGLFYYDEDKEYEGTGEEIFWEVQTDTLNKRWEDEYVNPIPEEYHSLFSALKAGKSITEWYENTQPTDYSKLDVKNEDTQRELIKQHLQFTGMEDDDIEDQIKEYEDAGTLEKNGTKALKYLQKNEDKKAEKYEKELRLAEEQALRVQEENFKKFKADVLSTEEIGKKKLTKQEREKLFDHITKPINKKGESQLVVNQKNMEKQLQMAYLDMIGFDFNKLEQAAETKAASGLRAKLSKNTDLNAKGVNGKRANESVATNKVVHGPWSAIK